MRNKLKGLAILAAAVCALNIGVPKVSADEAACNGTVCTTHAQCDYGAYCWCISAWPCCRCRWNDIQPE